MINDSNDYDLRLIKEKVGPGNKKDIKVIEPGHSKWIKGMNGKLWQFEIMLHGTNKVEQQTERTFEMGVEYITTKLFNVVPW